jgi:hypothetical protein
MCFQSRFSLVSNFLSPTENGPTSEEVVPKEGKGRLAHEEAEASQEGMS